jgi:hypothetical protein
VEITRRAHADYYLILAEEAESELAHELRNEVIAGSERA